jgi:hypothetical protein
MRTIKLTVVLLLAFIAANAQDSVIVANHTYYFAKGRLVISTTAQLKSEVTLSIVSIPQSTLILSIKVVPPQVYTYRQSKLPIFCAIEDRIWRRTGLDMQFRITERPMGSQ